MRSTCADELGGYDIRLRQRLDLDMWTRLVKRRSLYVTSDVLVFLRWHGKNISNTNPVDAHSRWLNEHFLLAESFFDDVSKELFVEAFGDLLVHADPPTEEHCDIEKALLHLRCRSGVGALNAVAGLRRLHQLLGSPRHRPILAGDYGIDHVVFHRLSGETGTFRQALQPPAGDEAGARLVELERTAAECRERLDTLLASRSWRVLAPLRRAERMIASRWRRSVP